MADIKNLDLRQVDGGTIYMPPWIEGEEGWGNLALPDPYVGGATQRYPRGTMFRKGNKSWVHTKLFTTTRTDDYGGVSGGLGLFSVAQDSSALSSPTGTKGENTVTVTSSLGTANLYAGGILTLYEAGQPIVSMGIVSHTDTVITLDGNLPGTYTTSATCHVVKSLYHDVVASGVSTSAGSAHDYCPGIHNAPLDESGNRTTIDDFIWLQCHGPCFTWASGSYEGSEGGERTVVMMGDGASQIIVGNNVRHNHQIIGWLYPGTGDVTVGNNPDPTDGTDVSFMNHIVFLTIRQ